MPTVKRASYTDIDKVTGKRVKKYTKKYYGNFRTRVNGKSKLVKVPLSEDKKESWEMFSKILANLKKQNQVIEEEVDEFEQAKLKPLLAHVDDHKQNMTDKGITEEQVRLVDYRIRRIIEIAELKRLGDLKNSKVEMAVAWLRKNENCSIRTLNFYVASIRRFTRWLVRDRRLPFDPLTGLERYGDPGIDIRHQRRALTTEEIQKIVDTARKGGPKLLTSGEDRAIIYTLAVYTGLRASEIASLYPGSFELDAEIPVVIVEAKHTKNSQKAILPLHPEFVPQIRHWLKKRIESEGAEFKCFPGWWKKKASEMLQFDMTAADIPFKTNEGVADFHSLRHTYVTMMAKSGMPPKLAQVLARHSSIDLTMQVYTHVHLREQFQAISNVEPPVTRDMEAVEANEEEMRLMELYDKSEGADEIML